MIEIHPITGVGEIRPGDDLTRILTDALADAGLTLRESDVLVVTHKIVSKAEDRYRNPADSTPSPRARELAAATGKNAAHTT